MTFRTISIPLFLFAICFNSFSNGHKYNTSNGLGCESTDIINAVIELKNRSSKIIIPDRIVAANKYDGVLLNILVKDYRSISTAEDLELHIIFDELQTTLDPIKIPPPSSAGKSSVFSNISLKNNQVVNLRIPNDAYTFPEFPDGIPNYAYLYPGRYEMSLILKKIDGTELTLKKPVSFDIYDNYQSVYMEPEISDIYKTPSNDKVVIDFKIKKDRDTYHGCKSLINFYFQRSDGPEKIGSIIMDPMYFDTRKQLTLSIKPAVYSEYYESNYYPEITCTIFEHTSEENDIGYDYYKLTKPFNKLDIVPSHIKSDIQIKKVDISWSRGGTGVYINCTIKNTGLLDITESSQLDLYGDYSPTRPTLIASKRLRSLKVNQEVRFRFYTSLNYYFNYIRPSGGRLRLVADSKNEINEIDENNNIARFRAPYIRSGQTITVYPTPNSRALKLQANQETNNFVQKPYPNPFTKSITFSFDNQSAEAKASLTIYDTKGMVVDQVNIDNSITQEKQKFSYNNDLLVNGLYFYNLDINGKQYRGSIVKGN